MLLLPLRPLPLLSLLILFLQLILLSQLLFELQRCRMLTVIALENCPGKGTQRRPHGFGKERLSGSWRVHLPVDWGRQVLC